jgi:putative transport protein
LLPVTILIVLLVGHYVMRVPYDDLLGVASSGQPEIRPSCSTLHAGRPTARTDIAYAMIFPSATIVKLVAVQIVGHMA